MVEAWQRTRAVKLAGPGSEAARLKDGFGVNYADQSLEGAASRDALFDVPRPDRLRHRASVVSRNWLVFRRKEFSFPARRERRAYPSAVCEERATKREAKRTAARRV